MFDQGDRECYESCRDEDYCGDGELIQSNPNPLRSAHRYLKFRSRSTHAVSKGESRGRAETANDSDCTDHEEPIDYSDIYLTGSYRARMFDPDAGEGVHPNQLVDQGESPGDHGWQG